MKRRYIHLCAAFLGLFSLIIAVIVGCSSAYRESSARFQADATTLYSPMPGVSTKNPTALDPTMRRVIESQPGEELWIIGRADKQQALAGDEMIPGGGVLAAKVENETKLAPVPLKHTNVAVSIAGYIATVDVTQQYENPYSGKIEAVYVFPLPDNAAVSEFVMTIGERRIRGIIREREEAERIYKEARSQGYVATLLTQERPNIFTQKVANIEPGKKIDVNLRYFHTLGYNDGAFEFVFPMVIGPRFNPAGSGEGVGAVSRDGRGSSGQKTEIQYLRPNERSGHDISLSVAMDAGVPIEKVECASHAIERTPGGEGRMQVKLAAGERIPNKDFVLRYQVAGKTPKSAFFASRDARGGYFTLMILPPRELADAPRQPLEMVFTLDTSGSMDGRPIEQSKAAMRYALTHMNSADSFQIINFSDHPTKFAREPVAATPRNVQAALEHLARMQAEGGTMLVDGLRASLLFPPDSNRLRLVAFLTDGFIGNEDEALRELHNCLGPARVFSFGVGSSPNRFLMNEMARMGRGAAAYVGLNENPEQVMAQFFERVSHPAMTDVRVDWGTLDVREVYPSRVPDLFVGRPVILTGRFNGSADSTITIRGKAAGEEKVVSVPVRIDAAPTSPALPVLWARTKIADLMGRAVWEENRELPQQVKTLAMEYGVVSPYTAFLAVDASERTAGNVGTTVNVPVPAPEGVRYETTVGEGTPQKAVERADRQ
ncbi:MAG TPA: VIT domain-containing protein [Tepidisphaeraceae bacterium]|jgi:Ca-activated chloride channel family protein|nr:VIT domain-containing protein [Tepidisphaeraceae bacterium]